MLQKSGPEIGVTGLNSTPDSGASFSCRCTTSNVVDCLWVAKAVYDVGSRVSARKTGSGIWRQSYGTDFWSMCQNGMGKRENKEIRKSRSVRREERNRRREETKHSTSQPHPL